MGEKQCYADNWNEQLDEITALRSILGFDFRMMGFDGCPKWDESGDLSDLLEWQMPYAPVPIHCQVNVFVEVPSDGVRLSIVSPCSSRSNSDEMNDSNKVHHLPPICLSLDLVPEYPSDKPPEFHLSAFWLSSRQISSLAAVLDQMWNGQPGVPICFTWIDWLQRSLLETINCQTEIVFDPQCTTPTEMLDHRVAASADEIAPRKIVRDIVQHDRIRSQHEFEKGAWSCPICMEEAPGCSFVRFYECRHYFCKECFRQYCLVNINEGNVVLDCPAHKCTTPIGPSLLKKHLETEAFDRWETLLLQRTLETMSDIVYCPRCSTASVQDKDNFAQCPKCLYAFCTKCTDAYHPGRSCVTLTEKIQKAELDAMENSTRCRYIQDLKNQALSVTEVEKTTKPCPWCDMAIEKTGGCNHMYCTYCHTHYCYLCGEVAISYDHFGASSCVLFSQDAIDEWEQEMNPHQGGGNHAAAPRARPVLNGNVQKRCPVCGTPQGKRGRDNLMRCYVCSNRFCFTCCALLPRKNPLQHFGHGCVQHSDD